MPKEKSQIKVKNPYMEGNLAGCKGSLCSESCCNDEYVEEWINEFFLFHDKIKDYLISLGIEIEFARDRVNFKKCSDGKRCKFLTNPLNKSIDTRPIDCKIYPFVVDWETIDFKNKIVNLFYWGSDKLICPFVKNKFAPEEFKKEVEKIIKRDFSVLFYGADFELKFLNKVWVIKDS